MRVRTKWNAASAGLLAVTVGCGGLCAQAISSKGAAGYTVGTFVPDGTLRSPAGVEVDAAGHIYVIDNGNFVVRTFDSTGNGQILAGTLDDNQKNPPTTVAKADRVKGVCYTQTGTHCLPTQAIFSSPRDVAIDKAGNVYISDIAAGKIKKIEVKTGKIVTYAGGKAAGWSPTLLHAPAGLALDSKGNLYVADKVNNAVRMITPPVKPAKLGTITTIAGLGPDQPGCAAEGAVAATSMLNRPQDVAVDAAGNIYIADTGCRKIRKIATDGTISTVAGTGANHVGDPPEVPFTAASGVATAINLANPLAIALDKGGNILIADPGFDLIWLYSAGAGTLQVLAGLAPGASVCTTSTNPQGDGCNGNGAFLNSPGKPAIDAAGNVYIPEQGPSKSPAHPFDVRILRPTGQ